jgi:hypothetical protein
VTGAFDDDVCDPAAPRCGPRPTTLSRSTASSAAAYTSGLMTALNGMPMSVIAVADSAVNQPLARRCLTCAARNDSRSAGPGTAAYPAASVTR